jgi:hypothetical protein
MRLRRARGLTDIVVVTHQRLSIALSMALLAFSLGAEGGTATIAQPKVLGRVIESLPLHLHLAGMKAAKAPEAIEGELVLSAYGPFRAVAAAFSHEGFAELHPYERNAQGVFVLAYPIPLNRTEPLEYRVIVDGVWTLDSANPERRTDSETGLSLSVARVPCLSDLHLGLYRVLDPDSGIAHFVFRGASGESVTVCGDFDNWDPFIHEMSEASPGLYRLELPLPPGKHYYTFVYRGEILPDPLNPVKARNKDGKIVSVLEVNG